MNNRGQVVTYLPFKKYLIFVLVIFGLGLLYYFYIMNSAGLVSLPKSCPEGIVPDRILLRCGSDMCSSSVSEYFWNDGTKMNGGDLFFWKGSREGDNVNYFYARDVYYQKTPINSDGTIGKRIEFKVELAINPEDKTDEGYKIMDYKCKS